MTSTIQCVTKISTLVSHFVGVGMPFCDKHMRISNSVKKIQHSIF